MDFLIVAVAIVVTLSVVRFFDRRAARRAENAHRIDAIRQVAAHAAQVDEKLRGK